MSDGAAVAAAPTDAAIASAVARVTFFEDRAEVVRTARAEVAAGSSWLAVAGIAVTVDDSSLVARVEPAAARVLAARIVRRTRPAAGAAEIELIEADLRAARTRRAAADRALERAASAERRATGLLDAWRDGVQRVPRGGAAEAGRWRDTHAAVARAMTAAHDEVAAARAELDRARDDEARAALRLGQARAQRPRYAASAEVQIEAPSAGPVTVELRYRAPCALWRPEHVARLVTRPDGAHELELGTVATVWQRTGEDWRGVACRFSTARPARPAAPPLLDDDVLRLQRRLDRSVQVEARDQTIALAGVEGGTRKLDDMPGLDDGGEPLWLEAARPVTIPSDGQPFRVDIGTIRIPCAVELVAYPELGPVAHVRATATLTGDRPLLAGPVRLARGPSIVGRARLPFVGQGEPFEIGFGADDGVRVRRRVDERREVGLTGTQRLTRTVHVYLSNLGGEPRKLTVVERVPVSEIEDVEVIVLPAPRGAGPALDAKDGFARFTVELAGNATRELELGYRVEARGKVQLRF